LGISTSTKEVVQGVKMDASSGSQHSVLLQALHRFEAESLSIQNRQELVRFFCLQVIPFLTEHSQLLPLWEELRTKYEALLAETEKHETNSIFEIKKAFRQVDRKLKARQPLPKELELHLEKARSTILKDHFHFITHPVFRIYEEEFRSVLQELLTAGFRDICEKHTELVDLDKYVQKDPSEKERWGILNDQGKIEKIVSSEEVSESEKFHNPRFICIRPEMVLVRIPAIRFYTYAPSTLKALAASEQAHWDQSYNPAVVWRYFETALLLWNTPASHFEKQLLLPRTSIEALEFWRRTAEYSTWREISRVKEGSVEENHIVIFTEQLFKKGFKTLINAVTAFLAKGTHNQEKDPQKQDVVPEEKISLELFWHCEELWISVNKQESKECLCIQKFYDTGYPGGSDPHQFCKKIVECVRDGVPFPRQIEFDRAAHTLNRMKLPKALKKLYFGTTRKNSVTYRGPQLLLNAKIANSLISELQEIHRSNGSPDFE